MLCNATSHMKILPYFADSIRDGEFLQFWTRGNDLAYEDVWVWALTRTPVSQYNVTTRDSSRQNCLSLTLDTTTWALQPQLCSEEKFIICEVPKQYITEGNSKNLHWCIS